MNYIDYKLSQPLRSSSSGGESGNMDTTCEPPVLSRDEKNINTAEIANSLGVTACNQSAEFASKIGQVKAKIPFASASAKIQINDSKTAQVGCEQIDIIAEKIRNATANVSCILNKNTVRDSKTITAKNNILFEVDDLTINCDEGLSIDQNISINMVSLAQLTDTEITQIADSLDAARDDIKSFAQDAVAKQTATSGGGQKSVFDRVATMETTNYKKTVDEKIKEMSIQVNANNDIIFKGKKATLSGRTCKMNQNILIDIVASAIVDATIMKDFSNILKTDEKTTIFSSKESEAEGMETQTDEDIVKVTAGIGDSSTSWYGYAAVAAIIIVIIIVVVIAVVFSRGTGNENLDLNSSDFIPDTRNMADIVRKNARVIPSVDKIFKDPHKK